MLDQGLVALWMFSTVFAGLWVARLGLRLTLIAARLVDAAVQAASAATAGGSNTARQESSTARLSWFQGWKSDRYQSA